MQHHPSVSAVSATLFRLFSYFFFFLANTYAVGRSSTRCRFINSTQMSRWGWVNFDWADGGDIWQDRLPHDGEATVVKQCKMVKAKGTGTRCMVGLPAPALLPPTPSQSPQGTPALPLACARFRGVTRCLRHAVPLCPVLSPLSGSFLCVT